MHACRSVDGIELNEKFNHPLDFEESYFVMKAESQDFLQILAVNGDNKMIRHIYIYE